jgi:hypothetical protein
MIAALLLLLGGQDASTGLEENVGALIRQLGTDDRVKREEADRELRKIGKAAERWLEAATRDGDPERSARARAILTSLRISSILGEIETGIMDAEHLEARVACSQQYGLRGLYRHSEHGRKFALTLERDGGATPPRSCSLVSDGSSVLQVNNFGTQNGENLYEKFSAAGYEKRDLGRWSHYGFALLAPPQLFRLLRSHVAFDSLRGDSAGGVALWILEGTVAEEKRPALTYSGFRSSHSALLRADAEERERVQKIRLGVAKEGGGTLLAEGLKKDGTTQWFFRMSGIKPGKVPDAGAFKVTIPENTPVLPGD